MGRSNDGAPKEAGNRVVGEARLTAGHRHRAGAAARERTVSRLRRTIASRASVLRQTRSSPCASNRKCFSHRPDRRGAVALSPTRRQRPARLPAVARHGIVVSASNGERRPRGRALHVRYLEGPIRPRKRTSSQLGAISLMGILLHASPERPPVPAVERVSSLLPPLASGQAACGIASNRLLSEYGGKPHRGVESLPLRWRSGSCAV
jgi:hypothetical protein